MRLPERILPSKICRSGINIIEDIQQSTKLRVVSNHHSFFCFFWCGIISKRLASIDASRRWLQYYSHRSTALFSNAERTGIIIHRPVKKIKMEPNPLFKSVFLFFIRVFFSRSWTKNVEKKRTALR